MVVVACCWLWLVGWLAGWLAGWLVGWLVAKADQLHLFLALKGKEATRFCRYLNIRGSRRSSDDVQPARLFQQSWAQHRSSPICANMFLVCLCTPLTIAEGTLSMSAVHPFFEFVLQHCHALCHVFVSCEGSSDTPACGPPFILEQTAFAHPAFFRTESQSSSDWSLPFSVQHLRGLSPNGSNTLAAVSQEGSFLSRVFSLDQSRADGHRKNVALRGIHKAPLERSSRLCRLASCCVFSLQLISLALCSIIGVGYSRSPVSFLSIFSA